MIAESSQTMQTLQGHVSDNMFPMRKVQINPLTQRVPGDVPRLFADTLNPARRTGL